jgi:hypothetical protein
MTPRKPTPRWKRILARTGLALAGLLVTAIAVAAYLLGPFDVQWGGRPDDPAPAARWPWPGAAQESLHPGVTRWIDRSSPDGTVAELYRFDFAANPGLRFEIYDRDQDDAVPFDDRALFWQNGVGQATRHLNATGHGQVVAAWNGLFFTYTGSRSRGIAHHVAPMVLDGTVRYNVGTIRWAVGAKYVDGYPVFKALRMPSAATLAREFDFAAEGGTCLIREGAPLRLRAFPQPGEPAFPPSEQPLTDADAGFVRLVDHIRTSRTSIGWSRDSRQLYTLIVRERESEAADIAAFHRGVPLLGGWTVADLQRFWGQLGVWGAVNLDGGDVTQLTALRPDGRYDMVPPRWVDRQMRRTFTADFPNAPSGGTLMYFYVRDTGR